MEEKNIVLKPGKRGKGPKIIKESLPEKVDKANLTDIKVRESISSYEDYLKGTIQSRCKCTE